MLWLKKKKYTKPNQNNKTCEGKKIRKSDNGEIHVINISVGIVVGVMFIFGMFCVCVNVSYVLPCVLCAHIISIIFRINLVAIS